jgi:uncharacterized protein with FMN-binding domain
MSKNQSPQPLDLGQIIRKFFLSSFVVITFVAYVVHQRFTHPDSALSPTTTPSSITAPLGNSSSGALSSIPAQPGAASQSSVIITNQGLYKDGTYRGPQVDVYYGIVEVQVNVQNGKIANVDFVQYPNDRRTSVRINNIAMPYLQQEAIQAQSARVNIISGATLTSEGFMMSLDAALKSAKNQS